MLSERVLNKYYNEGAFNHPNRIGYMISMIRKLKPLTMDEWKTWYLSNVHDEVFIHQLAIEMNNTIPLQYGSTVEECEDYIHDVMFRRTFQGYNRENQALYLLRQIIDPSVEEAPKEWDTQYFIDFYLHGADGELIGIQLKPDTFYYGRYQYVVDIHGKMCRFCEEYGAKAFVLKYKSNSNSGSIEFDNPEVIREIKSLL